MILRLCIFCLLVNGLTACVSWPSRGSGGMAEYKANTHFDISDTNKEFANKLLSRFHILANQLNILELKGANDCFPATVTIAKTQQNRISRQLYGELYQDAENDLIIQSKILIKLENKLDYVLKQKTCIPINKPLLTKHKKTQSSLSLSDVASVTNNQVKFKKDTHITNTIKKLLNSDNQFSFNSSKLNPKYIVRLAEATILLRRIGKYKLLITGHTDSTGDKAYNKKLSEKRARNVKSYLLLLGIDDNKINFQFKGSTRPIFNDENTETRLINRRTNIHLIINTSSTESNIGGNNE